MARVPGTIVFGDLLVKMKTEQQGLRPRPGGLQGTKGSARTIAAGSAQH